VCENQAKAAAVASTPARRTTLRRELPQVVQFDIELLGSCSMVSQRGLLPREHARVDACSKTLLTLPACARLLKGTCVLVDNLLLRKLPIVDLV